MRIIDFVPPVLLNVWRKHKPVRMPQSPLLKQDKSGESIVLIGNGPSLNRTIELYGDDILKRDCLVVNDFALTDYYERFKPNYYLLVDPAYFIENSTLKKTVNNLIEQIITKTSWPMLLCVPLSAKETKTVKRIGENNPQISLTYFDNTPRKLGKLTKYELWDRNLTAPPMQNCMNVSVYLALYWGYSESYLVGVDMTALEEIRVDQETNELFSIDKHFYESTAICADNGIYDKKQRRILSDEWTLHEYLYAFGKTFEGFYELSKYAEYKGLKVYNACEYSWINCFERKKLK